MTPTQLLRTVKPEEEPPAPPAFTETPFELTVPKYTSTAIDEDFSIGVDLLMNTPRFLSFLQDADDHYDILTESARKDLDKHLDTVQDFTGQWLNAEEVF